MKRLVALIGVVAVLLSVLVLPAGAVGTPVQLPLWTTGSKPNRSQIVSNGYVIGKSDGSDAYALTSVEAYAFAIPYNNGYKLALGAVSSGTLYLSWTSSVGSFIISSNNFDSSTGLYFYWVSGDPGWVLASPTIPVYNSLAEGLAAVSELLNPSAVVADVISPKQSYTFLGTYYAYNPSDSYLAAGWVDEDFVLATLDSGVNVQYFKGIDVSSATLIQEDSTTGLYYRELAWGTVYPDLEKQGPVFSTRADFLASALEVLQDIEPVPDTPTSNYKYYIPAGYVAYIGVSEFDQTIKVRATFNEYSGLISYPTDSGGSAFNSGSRYRFGASLPDAGDTFPSSGSQLFRWFKDASGQTNLLGQTRSGVAELRPTANFIEIYNPYFAYMIVNPDVGKVEQQSNPTFYLDIDNVSFWQLYKLSDSLDVMAPSGVISGSNDDFSSPIQGVTDPDTGDFSYQDNSGNVIVPPTGGDSVLPDDASITDILSNFFNRFLGIFTAGHDAIRILSQNAQEFMSRLASLYNWLPPQVLSVLTSAVILVIVIGVLKVFL